MQKPLHPLPEGGQVLKLSSLVYLLEYTDAQVITLVNDKSQMSIFFKFM
jgi:hypothetical protein